MAFGVGEEVVAERGGEKVEPKEEKEEEQGQEEKREKCTAARRRLAARKWWRCSPSPVAAELWVAQDGVGQAAGGAMRGGGLQEAVDFRICHSLG